MNFCQSLPRLRKKVCRVKFINITMGISAKCVKTSQSPTSESSNGSIDSGFASPNASSSKIKPKTDIKCRRVSVIVFEWEDIFHF